MKKILLLTLHSQNNNFGSVLQAHSLYKFLEEMGYDITVLNYQPFYSNGAVSPKMFIKKFITNTLFLPMYIIRTKRFNKFVKLKKLTKKIKERAKLEEIAKGFDIFMIGSDQVWNPHYLCGRDEAYFLKFTNSLNKISYAASIGTKDISVNEINNIIDNLKDFKFVTLRENESCIQLKKYGFNNVKYVLDPVFLYDATYYRKLETKNIHKKGYILAYVIHKDSFISKVIDKISIILNKPVIQVGGFAKKCNSSYFPRSAGPLEFLSLMDNADFVITSSFHGTAFAHIFNKQFAVVMPHGNTLRLENILETAGTKNRVINSMEDIDNIFTTPVDYQCVNQKIMDKRKDSIEYLKLMLDTLERER
jgi:hypothetical protein